MISLSYQLYFLPITLILSLIYQTFFEPEGFDSFSGVMPPLVYAFLYVAIAIILTVGMTSISLESAELDADRLNIEYMNPVLAYSCMFYV